MIPLTMIVVDELGDSPSEVALTKGNHSVETFLLD
jgi:hypothetical protein